MIRLYSGHKLKYLSCFFNRSCTLDYGNSAQKFCGNFSNILRHWVTKEMKYGRFTWLSHTAYRVYYCMGVKFGTLGSSNYHKMNVISSGTMPLEKFSMLLA